LVLACLSIKQREYKQGPGTVWLRSDQERAAGKTSVGL